jgi:hypothetical protein
MRSSHRGRRRDQRSIGADVRQQKILLKHLIEEFPAENGIFEPFIYKNDHLTKTGSGQT